MRSTIGVAMALMGLGAPLAAQEALRVRMVLPEGGLRPSSVITVLFDRPLAGTLERLLDPSGVARLTPAIAARFEWRDPATLRVIPRDPLVPGTRFTLTIDTTVVAPDGSRLPRPFSRAFTVLPPQLLASAPFLSPGEPARLEPTGRLRLRFSGMIDSIDLARTVRLEPVNAAAGCGRELVRFTVATRAPRPNDAWELAAWGTPRDSIDQRFDRIVELLPVGPLVDGCAFRLVLPLNDEGLRSEVRYPVRTADPFQAVQVQCALPDDCATAGRLVVRFNAPVSLAALRGALRTQPANLVTLPDTATAAPWWDLRLSATPGQAITVTLDPALRDTWGRDLTGTREFAFTVGDRLPFVANDAGLITLPRTGTPTIRVRHVNVDAVTVSVGRLDGKDARQALRGRVGDDPGRGAVSWTVPVQAPLNEEGTSTIAIRLPDERWRQSVLAVRIVVARLARLPDGSALRIPAEVLNPQHPLWQPHRLTLQLTDLMAHARVGSPGGGVFVTNVRTGRPVRGSTVRLLDEEFRATGSAVTNADGLVNIAASRRAGPRPEGGEGIDEVPWGDPSGPYRGVALVEATLGADRVMVPIGGFNAYYERGRGIWPPGGGSAVARRALVYTERGIYRPGETVYFSAVVRDGWLHQLLPPPAGESVRWRVFRHDPMEERPTVLLDHTTRLGAWGATSDSVRLPARARLGDYTVRLERRQSGRWTVAHAVTLRVAEYRAPEFTVTASVDSGPLTRGDTVRGRITGRLLLDAPLVGATAAWVARFNALQPWDIHVPGLGSDWIIGHAPSWWGGDRPEPATAQVSGTATLGSDGRARVLVPTDSMPAGLGARVTLDASATELSGQAVTASTTATVAGAGLYVAARTEGVAWWWRAGREQVVRVGAVRPAGGWVTGTRVRFALVRQRWVRDPDDGGWGQRADTLQRDSLVTADSSARVTFIPPGEGILELHLTARDAQGRETSTVVSRYVVGDGRGFFWGDDPTRLPVFVDRDSVKAGTELTVSFSSPFDRAHAWIAVERDGVLWQERRTVQAGANVVRLRVDERWIPNAFVSVALVREGDLSVTDSVAERYRLGSTEVHVDRAPRVLSVALHPLATEYRPGDQAVVDVRVRDHRGRGVRGQVVVWATDEGVLSLTAFKAPPVADDLLARTGDAMTFGTSLTSLVRLVTAEQRRRQLGNMPLSLESVVATGMADRMAGPEAKFAAASPTGGALDNLRADFRSTAFFRAGLVTDGAGEARVRVPLPDNVTTFRLMAIAVDSGGRVGTGEGTLLATKPLIVRAAMPRFVRPGDQVNAGAVVNARGIAGPLTAQLLAVGDSSLALSGGTTQALAVGAEGAVARFQWIARPGDSAVVKFGVTAGRLQDAVQAVIPVRPDQHPLAQTLVALVRDSATLRFALPAGIDPARSRLTLRAGPTPLPVIRAYESYLDVYPHACSEQLASAGRTLIALLELERAGATRLHDAAALRGKLQRVVDLLVKRQAMDGSFGYWSANSWSTPWLTSWVGTVLQDARSLDIDVPRETLLRTSRYLQGALASSPLVPDTTFGTRAERARVIATHLSHRLAAVDYLSREGMSGPEVDLLGVAARLTFEDRARLATVLARVKGREADGRRLVDDLWQGIPVVGNRVDMPDSSLVTTGFPSRIRPAAWLLRATQVLRPDHPRIGPLVQRIIQRERVERGWWWNTQDYAFAAGAIASFIRGSTGNVSFAIASAGGNALLRGTAGAEPVERSLDLATLTMVAGDSVVLPLRVTAPGGSVYVTATVEVVQHERPVAPATQGLVVERWYERFDNGTPVTEVKAGELVRVRLRVTAPADREFVSLEDPLPGGLEGVDTRLLTSGLGPYITPASVLADRSGQRLAGGTPTAPWGGWSQGWGWSAWEESAIHDDRVTFYARQLTSGTHLLSYVARATTAGRFVRPQALAEEMYNPALAGRSDGGWFVVRER